MNELQIFENAEFGQIRTVTINDETWFVASDVCSALDLSNPTMAVQRLEEDEKAKFNLGLSGGDTNCVNEYGLYNLVLASRKGGAKRFKRWITHEVLPSIRRTGSYNVPMSTTGQIQLLAQGHIELEQKIDDINKDLQEFKIELPLLGVDMDLLKKAVNSRVVDALGGIKSNAYHDKSIRGKVYSDCWNELKRQFGFVKSYKEMKRSQVVQALAVIDEYELPIALQNIVKSANA